MATTTITSDAPTPALTTIFTPPSSCLRRTYTVSPEGLDATDESPNGYLTVWRGFTSDCYPTEATLSAGWVYISPGICPSAYSIASQYTDGPITSATCCPWYMHASESYYDCGSYPESTPVELVRDGTAVATAGYAWDTPIVIAWQSSDLSLFPRHPTATGSWNVARGISSPPAPSTVPPITVTEGGMFISATSTASSPAIGNTFSSSIAITISGTAATSSSSSNSDLSTGAKAGIGVGVSLGVIFAILGILFFWRRRRSRQKSADAIEHTTAELPNNTAAPMAQLADDTQVHEKPASERAYEAGGYSLSHELSGDQPDSKNLRAELEGDTVAGAEQSLAKR